MLSSLDEMSDKGATWSVLGFPLESLIEDWPDARLALALEQLWAAAQRPPEVVALWAPAADRYVCRWYVNGPAARMLDRARVPWRHHVIGQAETPPPEARPLLTVKIAS